MTAPRGARSPRRSPRLLTGASYAASAEMAGDPGLTPRGAFPGFAANREGMLRVIRNHRRAAHGESAGYEGLSIPPLPLDAANCPDAQLVAAARHSWDTALALGEQHGFRNAQATVIAPTGTIGLVMDCDTTGIEPDFALVKFKKLAGGGYFKIINRAVPQALAALGYDAAEIAAIERYALGHGTLSGAPAINHESLRAKGFDEPALAAAEAALATAFDIKFAFNKWTLGEEFCTGRLGLAPAALDKPGFDLLAALGFSRAEIDAANTWCCGAMTLEGAPHLEPEHLAVFDCASPCGPHRHPRLVGRKPHPDDGGGAALHLRGDLEDHQHAERGDGRGLQGRLPVVLAARPQIDRTLPRRLEAVAAAGGELVRRR